MKNKDLEKQICKSISPAKDKIWNKIENEIFTSTAVELETVTETGRGGSVVNRKKPILLFAVCGALLALIVGLCFLIPKLLPNGVKDFSGSFYIDINPSVQVTVDKDGNATEIIPLNQDAIILMQGVDRQTLIGKSGEQVANEIWGLAFEAGFISTANGVDSKNAILITGSLKDDNLNGEYSQKIKTYLTGKIKERGVFCAVITDKLNSNVSENQYGISDSKYQLIKTAISLGVVIDESEYAAITVSEINARISTLGRKLEEFGSKDVADEFEDLIENSLRGVERVLEGIEEFIENMPDFIQREMQVKVEILDDILDDIEDGFVSGRDLDAVITEFNQTADELGEYDVEVQTLKLALQAVQPELERILGAIGEIKNNLQGKFEEYREANRPNINGHIKPEDFEDMYEDWLEEKYEDYRENWDDRKHEWDNDHGFGGNHGGNGDGGGDYLNPSNGNQPPMLLP